MVEDCKCKECTCGKMSMDELIRQVEDNRKPFTEEIISDYQFLRRFNEKAEPHLFKWHVDPEDRTVTVLNDNNWKFQFDNEIPFYMKKGDEIKIKKGMPHRLIKGTNQLCLLIEL
tara:strand:+ start:14731 stop:15075 length:345 start_codon:yes stop_codon:yes gene_type:complete